MKTRRRGRGGERRWVEEAEVTWRTFRSCSLFFCLACSGMHRSATFLRKRRTWNCMPDCLSSIHPITDPSILLSIHQSTHPFIHISNTSTRPSTHSFIHPPGHSYTSSLPSPVDSFINTSLYPFVHSSIHPFICPFIHPERRLFTEAVRNLLPWSTLC